MEWVSEQRLEMLKLPSADYLLVVMDAAPFYDNKLMFRGIPDSLAGEHVEASECCLIHADNPLSGTKGVWLNPQIRVGYSAEAYGSVNPGNAWLSRFDILYGVWKSRVSRWLTTPWFKGQIVNRRLSAWKIQDRKRQEVGTLCLINECRSW